MELLYKRTYSAIHALTLRSIKTDNQKQILYLYNMLNEEKILTEIKETLISFGVEKIILFGSYAYGVPNVDSDLDLLVIKKSLPENETRNFRIKLKKALWLKIGKYNLPFDLIVDSEDRIKKRIRMGDLFYKEIYTKGKVIYA